MIAQFESWLVSLERLWLAAPAGWVDAARLAEEIASRSEDSVLRQAATQAIPVLRLALRGGGDAEIADAVRRRLAVVLDRLRELTMPRFGRRGAAPKPLSPEDRARKMLDLPIGVQLTCDDIAHAFRRAAKRMHPDAGGDAAAFRDLATARDALMHPGAHRHG
jgi:hypothetical protein